MTTPGSILRASWRVLKYSSIVAVTGGSVGLLYKNDWDVSSLGVVRFGRSFTTATIIVADYKRSLQGLDPKSDHYWQTKSKVHQRSAERLRDLCCRNGGAYIKVGQHLGALEFLLPIEYVETMKVLHSDAPKSPKDQLARVVKEDLGKEIHEMFPTFEDTPVGAASLAQVHRATLPDGTVVAVKVQHPRVHAHAAVDMATMEVLVRTVAWLFPDFQLLWLAEETKKNLPLELDFVNEARNCERAAQMFSHYSYLKVPRVYWDYTSTRVLTMEYCDGGQINDKEYMTRHGISVNEVSQKLGELYSEMIFVHGFIHCDPHPGNVLVKRTEKGVGLVLLDHGLYQSLTDDFRVDYCKLWRSILQSSVSGMQKYSERMGIGRLYPLLACMMTARSWDAITKGVDRQGFSKDEDAEIKSSVASYLPEISDILNHVPRQMLLIFKCNDLLRGIETTLETRANAASFVTMSRMCVRAVYRHKARRCGTLWCSVRQKCREQYYLWMLSLYQLMLWVKDSEIGRKLFRKRQIKTVDLIKLALS